MKPGVIRFRGYAIEQLIGAVSFPQMIWLMLRGDLQSAGQAALLEAALVSAVDHGPQAPSIAVSRMSVTCGLPLNGAMASAINVLDDIHGGAGEQCMELYADIARRMDAGEALEPAVEARLEEFIAIRGKIIAGFGHRFHPIVHGRFGSGSSRCKDYIAQWPDAARRMTLYATFVEHVRFGFQDHGHAVVKLRAQLAPRPESSPMRSRSPTKA